MPSAVSLVKSIVRATQTGQTPDQRHEELLSQVKRLRTLVGKSTKEKLHDELKKLEGGLQEVLGLERSLLQKESRDVAALQQELQDMKLRFALGGELQKRLDKVLFLLSELSARADTFASVKEEQKQRMAEFESRIQGSMERNYNELLTIEKSVAALEQKYAELRDTSGMSARHVRHIEARLNRLRQQLFEKKVEIAEKNAEVRKPIMTMGIPITPENELEAPPRLAGIALNRRVDVDEERTAEEPGRERHRLLFPELPRIEPSSKSDIIDESEESIPPSDELQAADEPYDVTGVITPLAADETTSSILSEEPLPTEEKPLATFESGLPPVPGRKRGPFHFLTYLFRKH